MNTNTLRVFRFVAAVAVIGCAARLGAQVQVFPLNYLAQSSSVTVTLGYGSMDGIYTIIPIAPNPPVNVGYFSTLKVVTGYDATKITAIQWFKDNKQLASQNTTYEVVGATDADSGVYYAKFTADGMSQISNQATIRVVQPVRRQLLDLSSRATISASNPTLIGGFVVAPSPGQLNETKYVLIRAVGPSLASLGVTHPLASPAIRIYNSDGTPFVPAAAPTGNPVSSVDTVSIRVGAFPLMAGAGDVAVVMPFPAGVYSVHVYSADGGTGDVLLEIYDISDRALWPY